MDKQYWLLLNYYKRDLTKQQYNTFKGQIRAGDYEGFKKGLAKVLKRK